MACEGSITKLIPANRMCSAGVRHFKPQGINYCRSMGLRYHEDPVKSDVV